MLVLINLDGAHVRRARMEAQLAAHGLGWERLGHDFRSLDLREIRRWFAGRFPTVRPPAYTLSGAELGCWASHVSAWARIHTSGASAGIVLEDDVLLGDDFARCATVLARDLGGFDVVYLGTSSRNLSRRRAVTIGGLCVHAPVGLVVNTWGYVVSSAWIGRLLAQPSFAVDLPVDHYLGGRGSAVRPRIGVLQPPCVQEDPATAHVSQIQPHTWRADRLRVVESARRRFLASRAGDWFYRIYRWL
jgi:glycosyl transferase family 25